MADNRSSLDGVFEGLLDEVEGQTGPPPTGRPSTPRDRWQDPSQVAQRRTPTQPEARGESPQAPPPTPPEARRQPGAQGQGAPRAARRPADDPMARNTISAPRNRSWDWLSSDPDVLGYRVVDPEGTIEASGGTLNRQLSDQLSYVMLLGERLGEQLGLEGLQHFRTRSSEAQQISSVLPDGTRVHMRLRSSADAAAHDERLRRQG